MTPYRVLPAAPVRSSGEDRGDDGIIAGVAIAVGAIPVVIALLAGHGFGGEATIGLILSVLGILALRHGAHPPPGRERRLGRHLRRALRRCPWR